MKAPGPLVSGAVHRLGISTPGGRCVWTRGVNSPGVDLRIKGNGSSSDTCGVTLLANAPSPGRMIRAGILSLAIGVISLSMPSGATGASATTTWTGAAGSLGADRYAWSDPANWSDGIPVEDAIVTIAPTVATHIDGLPADLPLAELELGGTAEVSLHPADGATATLRPEDMTWRSGTVGDGVKIDNDSDVADTLIDIVAPTSSGGPRVLLEGTIDLRLGFMSIEEGATLYVGHHASLIGEDFSVVNLGSILFADESGSTLTIDGVDVSSGGLIALGQNRIVLGEDPNTLLKNGGGSFLEAVIGGTTVGTDLGGIVEEGPTSSPYVSRRHPPIASGADLLTRRRSRVHDHRGARRDR